MSLGPANDGPENFHKLKMIDCERKTKEIRTAVAYVLVFRERSARLASRLAAIVEKVPQITDADTSEKMKSPITASIQLLDVTVDDIIEYFRMLSLKSPALIAHLLKYGSDEECFYKWNERLRLLSNTFNMDFSTSDGGIFDPTLDGQDKQQDVKRLRDIMPSLTNSTQNQKDILSLLDSQETNTFKTVRRMECSVMIKANSIKYDKILGQGMFKCSPKAALEKFGRRGLNQTLSP